MAAISLTVLRVLDSICLTRGASPGKQLNGYISDSRYIQPNNLKTDICYYFSLGLKM